MDQVADDGRYNSLERFLIFRSPRALSQFPIAFQALHLACHVCHHRSCPVAVRSTVRIEPPVDDHRSSVTDGIRIIVSWKVRVSGYQCFS